MKKYIILGIIITIQIFAFRVWTLCKFFGDYFHLSTYDLSLRINESINNDHGMSLSLIRVLHNKVIGILFDLFRHYMHFWDISFLVYVFSFTGIFGLVLGVWYITKLSRIKRTSIFTFLLVIPFIEILKNPDMGYMIKIIVYSLPYLVVIIYGYLKYLENLTRQKLITLLVLGIMSIWWIMVMGVYALRYCIKY